jgi:hypothetical protein
LGVNRLIGQTQRHELEVGGHGSPGEIVA